MPLGVTCKHCIFGSIEKSARPYFYNFVINLWLLMSASVVECLSYLEIELLPNCLRLEKFGVKLLFWICLIRGLLSLQVSFLALPYALM